MSRRIRIHAPTSTDNGGIVSPRRFDEDAILVEAARSGDETAYARLYEKYREKIYRIVCRYTRDKEEALDLCQETFIKAFQSLHHFRSAATFYTWLFRIAYNTCVDASRSDDSVNLAGLNEGEMKELTPSSPQQRKEMQPSSRAEEAELKEKVQEALDQLPEPQRSVFILHVMEDLQYKEIAEVMNCSVGTVMSRLYYARRKLRALLNGYSTITEP